MKWLRPWPPEMNGLFSLPETGGKIGKRLRSLEVKIGRLNLEVQDFIRDEASAQGIATRLVNRLNGIERGIRESKTRESELRREQESLQRRIGTPFPQEEELNEKIAEAARIQAELEEEGKKQAETEQQTEEGEDAGGMASLAPGEYLPPRRDTRLRLRHAAAQRVADALGKTAKNAAPVHVVQRFDELPAGIRKKHAGNAAALEGGNGRRATWTPQSRGHGARLSTPFSAHGTGWCRLFPAAARAWAMGMWMRFLPTSAAM